VHFINKTAAELAKKATAQHMAAHPEDGPKFVAGAIGPTNKTLSVSPSVENPAFRGVTYDEIVKAYYEQVCPRSQWLGCEAAGERPGQRTARAEHRVQARNSSWMELLGAACPPRVRGTSLTPKMHSCSGSVFRNTHPFLQAEGLWAGGVDVFFVETIFDTLNAKAALYSLDKFFTDKGKRIPVFVSGTIVDNSGRTLSGQTNEAFWNSVSHSKPFAIGLNCALGATDMVPYLANLARVSDCWVFAYPNAGLPNAMGGYDQTGPEMAAEVTQFFEAGLVNAVGGCCGSSYPHIAALKDAASRFEPRKLHAVQPLMRISGLEPLNYRPSAENRRSTFLYIGERCNVAGSIMYKKAIVDGDYDKAAAIALKQVRALRVGCILEAGSQFVLAGVLCVQYSGSRRCCVNDVGGASHT
jgi:methionine synthase I (cobalamin-dependent)